MSAILRTIGRYLVAVFTTLEHHPIIGLCVAAIVFGIAAYVLGRMNGGDIVRAELGGRITRAYENGREDMADELADMTHRPEPSDRAGKVAVVADSHKPGQRGAWVA